MRIVHWSDFNCPYSYIGLKRLTDAVNELDLNPEWELKAFELPLNHKISEDIDEIAKGDGLIINNIRLNSSRNAHRLAKFVQKNYPELLQELVFKIYEANFSKNQNISDIRILADIGLSLGVKESEKMLSATSYDFEVELDTQDALFNGITSTPHYIIHVDGQQLIIPGAFEKEDFKIALKDLISGEMKNKTFL